MPFIVILLLALTALPGAAQRVALISGNGQLAQENFPAAQPMIIRALNAANVGIPNATVTWQVSQGEGALSDIVTTTDANGQASAVFRGVFLAPPLSYRTSVVSATVVSGGATIGSVDFVVTTHASRTIQGSFSPAPLVELIAPTGNLTGPAGTVLARAVGVRVTNQAGLDIGKGVPNVGLRIADAADPNAPTDPNGPVTSCVGANNMVFTDQNGEAYCDLRLGNTPASGYIRANVGESQLTRLFFVTITPNTACTFNVSPLTQSVGSNSTSGSLSITVGTGQNCTWSASTAANWITITTGGSGTGNGTLTYTVAANTGAARTGVISVAGQTVTINQGAQGSGSGLQITTSAPLPGAFTNASYTMQFTAIGGTQPYKWSAGGTFPPGLGLNPNTGGVSGVLTTAGTFAFTIIATDNVGASVSQPYTITVSPGQAGGSALNIVSSSPLPSASANSSYSYALSATGTQPYQWSTTGSFPPGLVLTSATGVISGFPTVAGTYSFSVLVSDGSGAAASKPFTLTVNSTGTSGGPLSVIAAQPQNGAVGTAYSYQFAASGGTPPYQFSAGGTFPPGLGLSPTNGSVVGAPTAVGTFPFTIQVTDSNGASATQSFAITIQAAGSGGATGGLVITPATLANGSVGAAYQQNISASGACNSNPFGGGSVNWSLASGALPPGLGFAQVGSGAVVSGTATTEGSYTFGIRATDTCGAFGTRSYTILITTT